MRTRIHSITIQLTPEQIEQLRPLAQVAAAACEMNSAGIVMGQAGPLGVELGKAYELKCVTLAFLAHEEAEAVIQTVRHIERNRGLI